MTQNTRKISMAGSLILLAAIYLTACNLPKASPTPGTPVILTASAVATQAPTPIRPTATVSAETATPGLIPSVVPIVFLRTFKMVDAQHGWAASDRMALRTVDGGKTWQNVTPKDVPANIDPIFQVTAISQQAAWMIVPDQENPKKGVLFRTTDGGQTWQSSAVPFGGGWVQTQDNKKFAVLMADRGVAAGSQGVDLYQTSDGGATWKLISSVDPQNPSQQGIPFGGDKSGVTFTDSAQGWVTGFIPMNGATYLYATQDSGKTWKQVHLGLPEGLQQAQIETRPPVFFGRQEGILTLRASANVGQLVFYLTHNGGETWQATTPLSANGMVSITGARDILVWDGGLLHYSVDAGLNWQKRNPNVDLSQGLVALQFVDRNTGWALSQEGSGTRLYSTTDGGLTWR